MSTPLLPPTAPESKGFGQALAGIAKALGALLIIAAVSAAAAWAVFEYRIQAEQAAAMSQVSVVRDETLREVQDLKADIEQRQQALDQKVSQVEQAAQAAGLLLEKEGELTALDVRLKEIDTLKVDLRKTQEELDTKLKEMQQSVLDQIAKQGQETAQALSVEMRYKSLLIKAQGEVLLAQVHWSAGNRGLARDELALASGSIQDALKEAPESVRPPIKQVADTAEQARSALILEQSTARDSLNLLWHQVSSLLAPANKQ